ncbi:hypothetical protein ACJJTC_016436 [Scirpophaga incertulas]
MNVVSCPQLPLDSAVMGPFEYSERGLRALVSFLRTQVRVESQRLLHLWRETLQELLPFNCKNSTLKTPEKLFIKNDEVTSEKKEDEICISQRNFAIGICVAGVILMICVIAAIAFILARRRNPKTYSRTGSSLYSGPYTNTGYSHTS